LWWPACGSGVQIVNKNSLFAGLFYTGATELEPATSGVTGHFQDRDINDDGRLIAVFMPFLGSAAHRSRMVERSDF
jgi:hypothetical protein